MKKYEARIGFVDRYTGTDYEKVTFSARNEKEAQTVAHEKGNSLAYQYRPDTFFIDYVKEIA